MTATATAPGHTAILVASAVLPLPGQTRSDHVEREQVSPFSSILLKERKQGEEGG